MSDTGPILYATTMTEVNTSIIPSAWTSQGIFVQSRSAILVRPHPGVITTQGGFNDWQGFQNCTIEIRLPGYGAPLLYWTFSPTNTSYTWTSLIAGTFDVVTRAFLTEGGWLTEYATITIPPYANPYISTFTIARCNSSGTEIDDGTYVKIRLAAGVSSVSGNNTYQYKIYYKLSTDTGDFVNYFTVPSPVGITIDKTWTAGGSLSADYTYIFEARVTDVFMTSTRQASLPTSTNAIDIKANGLGLAFGKAAELDNIAESAWYFQANAGIQTPRIELYPGSISAGNGGYIDFHFNNSASDYTARIVEGTSSILSLIGSLIVNNDLTVGGKVNIGTVLYNNASGTASTITLSSSAVNFNYLEIFYRDNVSVYSFVKVSSPNGKYVSLGLAEIRDNDEKYEKNARIYINGTSVTFSFNNESHTTASLFDSYAMSAISITKIIGY